MIDAFPTLGIPYYKDKLVCVTGATGLIGSYVVKLLSESGASIRAIGHERFYQEFTPSIDCARTNRNLLNPVQAREAVHGAEIVIGCAGITGGVNLPKLDPVSYVGPATVIAINTLHACVEEGVKRFGYLSSTTVYAPSDGPVREEDVQHDDKLYPLYRGIGHSKRFLEKLCAYYHETTGIGVGIVRPSGAYGRFDNFDEKTSHVLPGMIDRALHAEDTFEVWGDGQDTRDFIHAQDVARCLLLATAMLPDADPVNAASGLGVTTAALAQTVLNAVGSDAKIVFAPSKPSALKTRLVDVSKAKKLLGFTAKISLEDGIRDTVEWRKTQ